MTGRNVSQEAMETLSFISTWLEPFATVPRKFLFTYYLKDSSVSLFEVDKKKMFLRRSPCLTLNASNLFLSNTVNIFSREIKLIDYGNAATKKILEHKIQCTLGVIHSHSFKSLGKIIETIYKEEMSIHAMKMLKATTENLSHFHRWLNELSSDKLIDLLSNGPVILIEIRGPHSVTRWKEIVYSNFLDEAYASGSESLAENELKILFSKAQPTHCNTAMFENSTLCLLEPHIILSGKAGHIIDEILTKDFKISALEMFYLNVTQAREFFEVYRGFIPSYDDLINDVSSGPCIAIELTSTFQNPVNCFRELVGPHDLILARKMRPQTLRAKYGINSTLNGIHCTDMEDDAQLEVEFFFRLLVQQ